MIRTRFLCLFIVLALSAVCAAKPHPGVDYLKLTVAGVPIHLVDADLNRSDIVLRPVVAPTGHRQEFSQMVSSHRPVAAINGTFFDTRTGITVGNLVSDGRLLSEGMVGSNLVFHKDGTVALRSSSGNLGRYKNWAQVDFAVGGGITLISNGNYYVNPAAEGFSDPGLFKPRPRAALGVTSDRRLRMVVVTQDITLWQMAHVMKELRCLHAINLDGGSSTGLSVGGTTMVKPQRQLTNFIGIFASHMQPSLNRAVQVAELRAQAHYQKAKALEAQGDLRLARSHYRQAVAKAPEQAGYWRAAGQVELQFGNHQKASRDLHRSAKLYLTRGELVAAQDLADQLLKLNADDLTAHLLAGECKVEQGSHIEAAEHLRKVLLAQPGHPRAVELMQVLEVRKNAMKGTPVGHLFR